MEYNEQDSYQLFLQKSQARQCNLNFLVDGPAVIIADPAIIPLDGLPKLDFAFDIIMKQKVGATNTAGAPKKPKHYVPEF